jgi:hypothetical protein
MKSLFKFFGLLAPLVVASVIYQSNGANAALATFNVGTYSPGGVTTSPPGTAYDFTGLPFTFTTDPLANQWGWAIGDVTPQDPSDVEGYIETWTGLTLDPVIEFGNFVDGATSFTTTLLAEIISVHIGGGELVFIFDTATLFTLSDYVQVKLCKGQEECLKAGGLSNFRTYNYTDNNQNVPEVPLPAALPLLLSALAGVGYVARRRKLRTA